MKPEYHIVIAAIFRGENPYLREWIEYHRLVGIEHFYLYDNDGGKEAEAVLQPYIDAGIVTRNLWTAYDNTRHDGPTPFGGRDKNHMAFDHAVNTYRREFTWVMKIDIDEFLFPLNNEHHLAPIFKTIDDNIIKGIRIPRYNFGSCEYRTRPSGLVLESYIRRETTYSNYKEMGNTRFIRKPSHGNSAHHWPYRLFSGGKKLKPRDIGGRLRVNHYYTKSLEEYLNRQNTYRSRIQTEAQYFKINKTANEVKDDSMLRFVPEIKRRLSEK